MPSELQRRSESRSRSRGALRTIFEARYLKPHRTLRSSLRGGSPLCGIQLTEEASDQVREHLACYRHDIELTQEEEGATGLIWRSDLLFLQRDSPRWTKRTYVFRPIPGGPAAGHERRRFLGFMHLRPIRWAEVQIPGRRRPATFPIPLIAEAYLAPPARMTRAPYRLLTLDEYSQYLGALPYTCLPFCTPHRYLGGYCAQAAVYMCLVIMSRHGARTFGPFDITQLAERAEATRFKVEGLTFRQMLRVLQSDAVGLDAVVEELPLNESALARSLRAYLDAGLPVVVGVDSSMLEKGAGEAKREPHCVVVVGYRRGPTGLATHFVYNDSRFGPYRERTARRFAEAAARLGEGAVTALTPLPPGVVVGINDAAAVIAHLRSSSGALGERPGPLHGMGDGRFHLLRQSDLTPRYVESDEGIPFSDKEEGVRDSLALWFARVSETRGNWFWAAEFRSRTDYGLSGQLDALCVLPAGSGERRNRSGRLPPPLLLYRRGRATMWTGTYVMEWWIGD